LIWSDLPPFFRYPSPWGIMRASILYMVFYSYLLSIPMRDYEDLSWCRGHPWILVIHPHEGLWDADVVAAFWDGKRLSIPMRDYEPEDLPEPSTIDRVIHPHEGLWECRWTH